MSRSILLLAALAIAANSFAEDEHSQPACHECACQECGCQANCRPVCRLVCEMKEVKEVCYSCKTDHVCLPGPSEKCVRECPSACENRDDCRCFRCLLSRWQGKSRFTVWKPSSEACAVSRNKLVKHEIVKQKPTYRWVVEYRCERCGESF